MLAKEFGTQNKEVLILLHGGGLSWWNYQEVAEKLQHQYHVILPILDGHAGSDADFTSIEDCAANMIHWIQENLNGHVLMLGGLSLGAQIALEIISQKPDICQYALIESANVKPSKFTHSMIKPMFQSCYGLLHKKWFAKLQFQSLRLPEALFEDYFHDTCRISKENYISFTQASTMYALKDSIKNTLAQVSIFVGENEYAGMRISAKRIHKQIQRSSLKMLPEMYHGEFSAKYSEDYAKAIIEMLNNQQ
jgi:pimeloyl-ACP methyl ester carboxylesterase